MRPVIFYIFFSILTIFVMLQGVAISNESDPSSVVAVVGDEKITRQDIEKATEKLPEPFRKSFEKKALDQLINIKVFHDLAIKKEIDKTPEFKAHLEKEKKRILAAFFMEKVIDGQVSVTPAEVKAYYENNTFQFIQKERVKIVQLVVETKKQADEIKSRLEKGEPFETLVRQYTNPTEDWITRGTYPEAFEKEIFSLEQGQISGVIQTKKGYHIARVIDKRTGRLRPFSEVRATIEKQLADDKRTALIEKYRNETGVEIMDQKK